MTKREIAFLTCRLLAVYIFMNGVWELGSSVARLDFFSNISSTTSGGSLVVNINNRAAQPVELLLLLCFRILPVILTWVAATGLWIFAGDVAKRIFDGVPDEVEEGAKVNFGSEARAAAFACLGIYFLLYDALALLELGVDALGMALSGLNFRGAYDRRFTWTLLVRMAVSLYLIFGNRGALTLWNAAQRLDKRNRL